MFRATRDHHEDDVALLHFGLQKVVTCHFGVVVGQDAQGRSRRNLSGKFRLEANALSDLVRPPRCTLTGSPKR